MSKKIRESLKANKEEILSSLPSTDKKSSSSKAKVQAIKAELVANPDVDESAAADSLK